MTTFAAWLPVGHISHGYRRVLTVTHNGVLRHVVNFAPMPYELVYQVRAMAGPEGVTDPSLWWGLSALKTLIVDGTLLGPDNPETADDGYLHVRPAVPEAHELIAPDEYARALQQGTLELSIPWEG